MADLDDRQVKDFCNQNCRPLADLMERTNRTISQFLLNVTKIEANAAYIAAADGDVIIDGSETDGRKPVTKLSIGQLKYAAEQAQTAMNVDDREQLVNNWTVNSVPLF